MTHAVGLKAMMKMVKVTEEIVEELRKNSLLPSRERLSDKELAIKFSISRATVINVKRKFGLRNKLKPSNTIGSDKESIQSFLKEYDEAGFGNRKKLLDKYGFTSIDSLYSSVNQLRKKLITLE